MIDLPPALATFVRHWGEMGTRWGINRTVAQVHALLYVWEHPLNADDLVQTLQVARSNISNSLKELQHWGLVQVVHLQGDRRDHFTTDDDVWDMFRKIMDERKRREFDPTKQLLEQCLREAEANADHKAPVSTYNRKQLKKMVDFFALTGQFYDQARMLPMQKLTELLRLGGKLKSMLTGRS